MSDITSDLAESSSKETIKKKKKRRGRKTKSSNNEKSKEVNLTFQEEAEFFYPKWDNNLVSIPSIFRHDAEGIPRDTLDKGSQAALKGPKKEKDFLQTLKEFCVDRPAIVLHSLKFKELFQQYNKLLLKHQNNNHKAHQLHASDAFHKARHYVPSLKEHSEEAEVDFVLLVQSKGIFLFEVKSSVGERFHAKEQLAIRQALMHVVINDAILEGKLGVWSSNDIPMYCSAIFPTSDRPRSVFPEEYYEDSFSSAEQWIYWWMELVESKPTLIGDHNILYHKIVARLVYTISHYMPFTLNEGIVELNDDLQQQKVLKTYGSMPRLVYDTDVCGEPKSTKLTNEQVALLNCGRRQIIVGPSGSGKTLIIAVKALQLSLQHKQVLLICGYDCEGLKDWYLKILELNKAYGHNHAEYVYVCTMKQLFLEKEPEVIEDYCFVDEVNEILGEYYTVPQTEEYLEIWESLCQKKFLWIATYHEISQTSFIKNNDIPALKISYLKAVLRNTVNIYNEFSSELQILSPDESAIDIHIGHDVEGLAVEHMNTNSVSALTEQITDLILLLIQKRENGSSRLHGIDYKDILVYLSSDRSVQCKNVQEDGDTSNLLNDFIKTFKDKHIPLKSTRLISNDSFDKPSSDSVVLAWKENDILSLEFVAVISCEIDCIANSTVLSRAVSKLFRIKCTKNV